MNKVGDNKLTLVKVEYVKNPKKYTPYDLTPINPEPVMSTDELQKIVNLRHFCNDYSSSNSDRKNNEFIVITFFTRKGAIEHHRIEINDLPNLIKEYLPDDMSVQKKPTAKKLANFSKYVKI